MYRGLSKSELVTERYKKAGNGWLRYEVGRLSEGSRRRARKIKFTAGTALSLRSYRPEEKDKVQGAINFCVFAMMMLSSFSSGALVTTQGWTLLNYGSLVPVALTGIAVLWYVLQGRSRQDA